jgi:hypothetical protein
MLSPFSTSRAAVVAVLVGLGSSAVVAAENTREIQFPDVPGYMTLVADLHQHTVFSDGNVWPSIRVEEGVRDGVAVVSMTDHLEYQPHADDIPHPDRNRSHHIAKAHAANKGWDILVVHGAEITRDMPPGHVNAVFINDSNKLLIDDPVEAIREAHRQGAFAFWNHPAWPSQSPHGTAKLTPMHEQLIAEGLLQGIEVVNQYNYSDDALAIALEHDLTIMGTSDTHGLVDWEFGEFPHNHRPVTLVYAEGRTEVAVKDALMAGRTSVWFGNTLIGRDEWLRPLLHASIEVEPLAYRENSTVLIVKLSNHSDAEYQLRNVGEIRLHNQAEVVTLPPHSSMELFVITLATTEPCEIGLEFEVLNAVTAPDTHPVIALPLGVIHEDSYPDRPRGH